METTHWADWEDAFKLQDAACLIAGVSPANEMVAWADKIPPKARPAFKKLWDSYLRATVLYKRPAPESVDFPKMLHGIPAEDFQAPTVASARGFIPRQEMLVAPSAELMRKRLESVRVSREELCRWVKAMGIKSAYSFQPQHADTQPQAASVFIHSTKARRDSLTPVIEFAQKQCRNPQDTAEVWAALQVLAEKKNGPLIGVTEDGLQYLKAGAAAIFKRDSLRKRLAR